MNFGATQFKPNRLTSYTEDAILEEVHRVVSHFKGQIPNTAQFKSASRVSLSQIRRQFGTYRQMLEKAGFSSPAKRHYSVSRKTYSEEEVLENLKSVLERANGNMFSLAFYKANGGLFASRESIKLATGLRWNEALQKIGAKTKPKTVNVSRHALYLAQMAEVTENDLLDELHSVWKSIGHCPTRGEFNKFSTRFSSSIYRYRFPSWGKAIEALCERDEIPMPRIPGTPLTRQTTVAGSNRQVLIGKDDLIADLKKIDAIESAAKVTYLSYKSLGGIFHIDTFRSHFGSWANAIQFIGRSPGGRGSTPRTDEEMFDEIQRVWEKLGKQPTFDEMKTHSSIHPHTYHNRFGTWIKAVHKFCEDREQREDELIEKPPVEILPKSSDSAAVANSEINKREDQSETQTSEIIIVRLTGRSIPKRLRFRVMAQDNFSCKKCGRSPKLHGISLEIDHIIPYSKGGETILGNLQTLCADCNRGKGNNWSI